MAKKMGRPSVEHRDTSSGKIIPGLQRLFDGRWKILATGKRFTEADEQKAIAKFYKLTGYDPLAAFQKEHPTVQLTSEYEGIGGFDGKRFTEDSKWTVGVSEKALWSYVAQQIVERPKWVAQQTGIEEIAYLTKLKPPIDSSIKLADVLDIYTRTCKAARNVTKNEVKTTFDWFIAKTAAKTVADLSFTTLKKFAKLAIAELAESTVSLYFGRIKTVFNSFIKDSEDEAAIEQINLLKLRMRDTLIAPENPKDANSHPISKTNYRKLLAHAEKTSRELWYPLLLMGLNCALSIEEVTRAKWSEIDLEAGTFKSYRGKKGKCPRGAELWEETIAALKQIPKKGSSPFVFVSSHGTRYNRNTKVKDFKKLCIAAEVEGVTFSHIRDASYNISYNDPNIDTKCSLMLCGHRILSDTRKYVVPEPKLAGPACEAVRKAYMEN